MSNLIALDSMWFNTKQGHFGLVLGEDIVTGERKLYGGVCSGEDQKKDELQILSWGNKASISTLAIMLSKVTHEEWKELGRKETFLNWLLETRGKHYPFVTYRGGGMKAELNLVIPFDEVAEFFGVDEITIRGETYKKDK